MKCARFKVRLPRVRSKRVGLMGFRMSQLRAASFCIQGAIGLEELRHSMSLPG